MSSINGAKLASLILAAARGQAQASSSPFQALGQAQSFQQSMLKAQLNNQRAQMFGNLGIKPDEISQLNGGLDQINVQEFLTLPPASAFPPTETSTGANPEDVKGITTTLESLKAQIDKSGDAKQQVLFGTLIEQISDLISGTAGANATESTNPAASLTSLVSTDPNDKNNPFSLNKAFTSDAEPVEGDKSTGGGTQGLFASNQETVLGDLMPDENSAA